MHLQVLLMGEPVMEHMRHLTILYMQFAEDKVNCMLGTGRDIPFQ